MSEPWKMGVVPDGDLIDIRPGWHLVETQDGKPVHTLKQLFDSLNVVGRSRERQVAALEEFLRERPHQARAMPKPLRQEMTRWLKFTSS